MVKVGTLVSALLLTLSLTGCPAVSPSAVSQPDKTSETKETLKNEAESLQESKPTSLPSSSEIESQSLSEQEQTMPSTTNVTITINGEKIALTLADNDTAQAFADMLPLEAEFSELNGNEKYLYMDQPLPSDGSIVPEIEAGDIMLYGDSCIVIFYQTHSNSAYSYTPIGKITNTENLASAVGSGNVAVSIEG